VLHYKKEETNTLGVGDEEAMGEVDSGITSDSPSASQQPGWSEPSQPSLSQSTASAPVVEEGTTVAAHLEEKKRKIEELATRLDIYELLARSVGEPLSASCVSCCARAAYALFRPPIVVTSLNLSLRRSAWHLGAGRHQEGNAAAALWRHRQALQGRWRPSLPR
jgi:hypothetical protein